MNEGQLSRKIQKWIGENFPQFFLFKVNGNGYQKKGIPDLIGCYEGRFIALEIKLPGGSYGATKLQLERIRQIREAGGVADVVTSIEEVEALLREVDDGII